MERQPFLAARIDDLRILHRADVAPETVLLALERHRANVEVGREACEHVAATTTVSRVRLASPDPAHLDLAVKWIQWRGLRGALSDLTFGSRAARAAAGAEQVAAVGLPAPATIAVVERRQLGLVRECFLVNEFVAGALPLPAVMPALLADTPRRRRVAESLGETIGRLHAASLDHADLKHANLMLGADDVWTLLDLDNLEPPRRLTWRGRVRALGLLETYTVDLYEGVPWTDRARFARGYRRADPSIESAWPALAAASRAWAERRLARLARKTDRNDLEHFPMAPRPDSPAGKTAGAPGGEESGPPGTVR